VNPLRAHTSRVLLALFFLTVPLFAQQLQVHPSPLALTAELKNRIDAAAYVQRTGTPEDVTNASKRVIGLALATFADMRAAQGSLPAAVALYKQSLNFEDTPEAHFWLALTYNSAGHVDDALRETAAVIAADPNDASAWNLQGKLQMQKQQYKEAAASLERSVSLKTDMEAAYTMATALLLAKENDKAAAVFKQMEDISNGSGNMHIMAARAYEGAGLADRAEQEYKAAVLTDAQRSHAHYFLGLFYLTRNQWESTPQIVQEFQQEVALNPTYFFGNYFLGYLASVEKNYDVSDKYLKVAAEAKPDWPEPYLYLGLNAYGRGDDKQAEELLRKAIKLTGADEARNDYQIRRAYFTLGRILIRQGKKEEGTRDSERSKEMETHLVMKARQQQALGSQQAGGGTAFTPESVFGAQKAIPLEVAGDPTAPVSAATLKAANLDSDIQAKLATTEKQLRLILGSAFNDLGTSLARQRNYAPALAAFKQAEHWNPTTANLLRNLGMAAYRSGDYAEAARALNSWVAMEPQDERAQGLLAMSLISTGDFVAATNVFNRLGDATLGDPDMAYNWALSLIKTRQPAQAKGVLQKMARTSVPYEVLVKACKLYADMGDEFDAKACSAKAASMATAGSQTR
jgi:tetratricopeptide (TPR) repeat protein